MLVRMRKFLDLSIQAKDGEVGKIEEIIFDDDKWVVRYLVVNTGGWLLPHKVLMSPLSVTKVSWDKSVLFVSLTKNEINNSPEVDSDKEISRLMEMRFHRYYRWPYYWTGAGIWGTAAFPPLPEPIPSPDLEANETGPISKADEESHVLFNNEVIGYHVEAQGGQFGHVDDFLTDEGNWIIRYLLIDTRKFWPHKFILLPPDWIEAISWNRRSIRVNLPARVIRQAPDFRSDQILDRKWEERLYAYYGRPGYWEHGAEAEQRSLAEKSAA